MPARPSAIGRARTALVFGSGEHAKAVIASVVVQVRGRRGGPRIRMAGPGAFEESVTQHTREVLLPIVDRICAALGIARQGYTISIANLDSTAASDVGISVSGFSADAAVLLALLAAAVRIPIPGTIAMTGHVASPDGDIALVRGLPAKLDAAVHDPTTRVFVLPALPSGDGADALAPDELRRAEQAVLETQDDLQLVQVQDVGELVRAAFSEEQVVLASLRRGFFAKAPPDNADSYAIGRAVQYFVEDNEARFWRALNEHALDGQTGLVKDLLFARAGYHLGLRTYPTGLGLRLRQLLVSLPPAARRRKRLFPLLHMQTCVRLGRFATGDDHEDLRFLIDACFQDRSRRIGTRPVGPVPATPKPDADWSATLESITSQISADALARDIGQAIDAARASYLLEQVTTEAYDEFSDVVSSFYLHLLRHARSIPCAVDVDAVAGEALELLESTFLKDGGLDAALAEARDGTRGGLRFVLDAMTERFKRDEMAKHVNLVLKTALDPLDWQARVGFMAALLEHLGPHLPSEIRAEPPERYAKHHERIVHAYVESLDRFKLLLRAL